jgi:carbon monoxide dehydrogenase subunit G
VTFTAGTLGTAPGKIYHLKYSFWTPPTEVDAKALTVTTSGTPAPVITSISPPSGPIKASVTITGTNFGNAQGSVTFNGKGGAITGWTPTTIMVTVPAGATSGNIIVTTATNAASNGMQFTVTH